MPSPGKQELQIPCADAHLPSDTFQSEIAPSHFFEDLAGHQQSCVGQFKLAEALLDHPVDLAGNGWKAPWQRFIHRIQWEQERVVRRSEGQIAPEQCREIIHAPGRCAFQPDAYGVHRRRVDLAYDDAERAHESVNRDIRRKLLLLDSHQKAQLECVSVRLQHEASGAMNQLAVSGDALESIPQAAAVPDRRTEQVESPGIDVARDGQTKMLPDMALTKPPEAQYALSCHAPASRAHALVAAPSEIIPHHTAIDAMLKQRIGDASGPAGDRRAD